MCTFLRFTVYSKIRGGAHFQISKYSFSGADLSLRLTHRHTVDSQIFSFLEKAAILVLNCLRFHQYLIFKMRSNLSK
jgi:hypothetical protein